MSPSIVKIQLARDGVIEHLVQLVIGFRNSLLRTDPLDDKLKVAITDALKDPSIEFTLATLNGVDVAYAQTHYRFSIWTHSPAAYIGDLFVLPSARRHHVARQMLNDIFERARHRGAKELTPTTNEENIRHKTSTNPLE